jgi:DNA modification methylase
VIASAPTRSEERKIAPHPSLKPQAFMRQLVRASLPLGDGLVLDPFMGAGSTIAAAVAVGYRSVGVESDSTYFDVAIKAVPELSTLSVNGTTRIVKTNGVVSLNERGRQQLGFFA